MCAMAESQGQIMKIAGIVLVIVGIGLLIWGFQLSDSIGSELTEGLTGAKPDAVMIRYIGGAASVVVGLYLLFKP
jgi:hypothetical protein